MNPRRLSGYTPADLQNMGFFLDAVHFFADDPRDADLTDSPTLTASEAETATVGRSVPAEPPSSEANLNTAPSPEVGRHRRGRRFLPALPPTLNGPMPPVRVPAVRRSKVSKLPEDIRNNLNALLHSGNSYSHIIAWLNTQGYIGFNKVNLHNWRVGGFQDWLQTTLTVGQNASELPSPDVSGSRSLGIEPDLADPNLNAESEFPGQTSPGLKPSASRVTKVL
jgi:hypothetical protein